MASSLLAIAGPALVSAAGECVFEQGSTTVYPSLVQAQPGYQGSLTQPQPSWPTAQKLGCSVALVANGSGTGKGALVNWLTNVSGAARVDVAASSAPLASGAEATNLMAFQTGGDAMVIAVNSTNPVNQITMLEVEKIFNGQITTWQQLAGANGKTGTIVPRSRITGSGSRDDMNRLFKVDRGAGNVGPGCSSGFTTCEPTVVAGTGLPRLTTSQDEADAACASADQIVYTSLANLDSYGPGSAGCTQAGSISGSSLKALNLQTCTFSGAGDGITGSCSGSFIVPTTSTAAVGGTYGAKRQLLLTLPKVSVMASKYGTAVGGGWTDDTGLTKAIDLVNYMSSTAGQTATSAVGFISIAVPAKQPLPDADIDLNGGIGLTDIGQITGRWNWSTSSGSSFYFGKTIGSVRADVDNNGGVGLSDIGRITGQWGAVGFQPPS